MSVEKRLLPIMYVHFVVPNGAVYIVCGLVLYDIADRIFIEKDVHEDTEMCTYAYYSFSVESSP